MGSTERRTRERVETRERIMEAAREMFVRHGHEATTMRAIAAEIEYTPTAIYHHFRNKEALLTELCTADFRALAGAFQKVGRIEDPIERLRRVGKTYVTFAIDHPMQYQLLFMTRHVGHSDQGVARGDPGEDAYAFLRDTCMAAIATGRLWRKLDDAEELAQIAWSSLHGLIALHVVKRERGAVEWRDIRKTAALMNDLLIRGMLKRGQQETI
ncbi:MAG: TetR/AcrR family transcriptional regulator; helix-turn-helix transcriptional regulator [Gemmatimonadaceae bacterium]|nr:TetR/AcrR family transcriptional regulator; helix-turn-helix transcriptional regulator [Gemmatimonadaceae bacterium]